MIRFILLAFLVNFLASIVALVFEGIFGQNVPFLIVLSIFILLFIFLLSRNFVPKAKPENLELLDLSKENINYRGLISYVSPILVDNADAGLTERKKILNELSSTLSNPQATLAKIKSYYKTKTRNNEPVLKLIEQNPKIRYVWLISSNSEARDSKKTKANSFVDAEILQSAIKSINSNIVVFMQKDMMLSIPDAPWYKTLSIKTRLFFRGLIKRNAPKKIQLHIDNLWSKTVLEDSYNIVDSIYENHLPYLGVREKDVLTEATTGPSVMRYGLLLAALPDNRDIAISLKGNISFLCKFSTIAQVKEK